MIDLFITVVFAILISLLLYAVFRWVGSPYYRIDNDKMVNVLERVLTGQATENEWYMTFGMTIRHSPELEDYRQQCCEIEEHYFIGEGKGEYLFSELGLIELESVLSSLKQSQSQSSG